MQPGLDNDATLDVDSKRKTSANPNLVPSSFRCEILLDIDLDQPTDTLSDAFGASLNQPKEVLPSVPLASPKNHRSTTDLRPTTYYG